MKKIIRSHFGSSLTSRLLAGGLGGGLNGCDFRLKVTKSAGALILFCGFLVMAATLTQRMDALIIDIGASEAYGCISGAASKDDDEEKKDDAESKDDDGGGG